MTEGEAYSRLADFIQDYIYAQRWQHLNQLQIDTIEAVEAMDHNLLLMAGTAQGKTEAAFLPAISMIHRERIPMDISRDFQQTSSGVGILYISPLKALINDQFLRIEEMLKGTGLTITRWHGDASSYRKDKLLEEPGGILQMTPESLEAMICCHPERIRRLFGHLRFIIIDEIHYFMHDRRGMQLICLLERMQRGMRTEPIRIGLSATIQNQQEALHYLCMGSAYPGKILTTRGNGRTAGRNGQLAGGHGQTTGRNGQPAGGHGQTAMCAVTATRIGKVEFPERYLKKILKQSLGKRSLLYANSRRSCEQIIAGVRKEALLRHLPDIFYVHHGSISRQQREETERIMKQTEGAILTGTTLTLELGIDIGDLDQVILVNDPPSIASMVQRLGRSGRRTGRSAMACHLRYREDKHDLESLDLQLVRSIAMIELYFREHYMEAERVPRYPYRLLAHTILSLICQKGCLQPQHLAAYVLELEIFQYISQEELRDLIYHMMDQKLLMQYEDGAIGLDDLGEKTVDDRGFYASFDGNRVMEVYYLGAEIGQVERSYWTGSVFYLAGRCWQVVDCDWEQGRVSVEPYELGPEEEAEEAFRGYGRVETDSVIMKKMYEILSGDQEYAYLDQEAGGILQDIRQKAARYGLVSDPGKKETLTRQETGTDPENQPDLKCRTDKDQVLRLVRESGTGDLLCYPRTGSRTIDTLYHILRCHDIACEEIYCRELLMGIRLQAGWSEQAYRERFAELAGEKVLIDDAYLAHNLKYYGTSYDMLPDALKAKEILWDQMDPEGARDVLQDQMDPEGARDVLQDQMDPEGAREILQDSYFMEEI